MQIKYSLESAISVALPPGPTNRYSREHPIAMRWHFAYTHDASRSCFHSGQNSIMRAPTTGVAPPKSNETRLYSGTSSHVDSSRVRGSEASNIA